MAVSRKGKRKIVVNETVFYWYVKWDDDWYFENIIYILNEKMEHVFAYLVGKDETAILRKSIKSPIWIESNGLHDPTKADIVTPYIV